jgi:hypothetical protein
MTLPQPKLERRLQKRYHKLVLEHVNVNSAIAAGPRALPGAGKAFASTQGAWRYYANPRVTLKALGEPLLEQARDFLASECQDYALVVHDWSNLSYQRQQTLKKDLIELGHYNHGYELLSSLLINDLTGMPLGMLGLSLTSSQGVYSTWREKPQERQAPLDDLSETMEQLRALGFDLPLVHIVECESNSIWHWRLWNEREDLFVSRATADRHAHWQERRLRLYEIASRLAWKADKVVAITAELEAQAFIAETTVTFTDPAYRRGSGGKRKVIKGEPFQARLIVVQLRLPDETVFAKWYLVTNLPAEVTASVIAEWYYWRWTIESATKLHKSAGLHVEQWQQETAEATAKRLLVAAMACVVVWQVQRADTPQMEEFRKLLLRLSGRQIRRGQATAPALLSGLWTFLAVLDALQKYDLKELLELASQLPIANLLEQIKLRQGGP